VIAAVAGILGHYAAPKVADSVMWGLVAAGATRILLWRPFPKTVTAEPTVPETAVISTPWPPAPVPANFQAWDRVDPLSLSEAAILWVGLDPKSTNSTDGEIHTVLTALIRAVDARKLKNLPYSQVRILLGRG